MRGLLVSLPMAYGLLWIDHGRPQCYECQWCVKIVVTTSMSTSRIVCVFTDILFVRVVQIAQESLSK
jgi:hypothetical protein